MNRHFLFLFAIFVGFGAPQVRAAPPVSSSGCGLSVSSIVQDARAWLYCLNPAVPKSDWDNWSLASAGPVLYPGNATAIAAARAWSDQIAFDLLHGATHIGAPSDIASWSLTRQAGYVGGNPSFVNSGLRVVTEIGSDALSSEWSILGIANSRSATSQAVAVYGQGNGFSTGTVWGIVAEAKAKVDGGTAVGLEVDSGRTGMGNAVGIDIVNTGNMDAAIRVAPLTHALVDSLDPTTFIQFSATGGIEFWVHGRLVQSFQ